MSATPLSNRALEKLRRILNGNGVSAEDVTLRASDEAAYDIPGLTVIDLNMDFAWDPPGKKSAAATKPESITAAELNTKLEKDGKGLYKDSAVTAAAIAAVRAMPGEGWGANDQEFPLPQLSHRYLIEDICPQCHGNIQQPCEACGKTGRQPCRQCPGDGWVPCKNCHGTGSVQQPDGSHAPCHTCQGTRRLPCPGCHGRGYIPCKQCNGRGWMTCRACHGKGKIHNTGNQNYRAHARFRLDEENDLPQPVQEGVRRLGAARLAEGHAEIRFVSSGTNDRGQPVLRYAARLDFARLTFDVKGLEVKCAVLGRKAILQRVPLVLENLLKPGLIALNEATLAEACRYRLIREILQTHLEQPRTNLISFIARHYPYGLGKATAEVIAADITAIVAHRLRPVKAAGLMVGAALAAAIFYARFMGPWREMAGVLPQDMLVLAAGAVIAAAMPLLMVMMAMPVLFGKIVNKKLRLAVPRPSGWSLGGAFGAAVLFAVIIFLAHTQALPWPSWLVAWFS